MVEVIKFGASWCTPCKVVAKQLEGLDFTSIDIDEDTDGLARKSNIRNVPTLVFLKDGVEVSRHSGLITRQEFIRKVEGLENEG